MALAGTPQERIRIVLARPASPGNVGSVARAMMNFGLGRLYLVDLAAFEDPAYFESEARKLAWRAGGVLDEALRPATLGEALRGTAFAIGASPRGLRGAATLTPREAAAMLVETASAGEEAALVFGGEADGLRNEELSALAGIVTIPTGEAYVELNLAQAAVVCCYEIFLAAAALAYPAVTIAVSDPSREVDAPAPFEEVESLFELARGLFTEAGYLKPGSEYLAMELHRLLARARPRGREVNLLRGILRQIAWAIGRAGE